MIKDIAQYIENNTSLTIGTDFFVNFWPNTAPDTAVLIRESSDRVNTTAPEHSKKMVQIMARGQDPITTRTNLLSAVDLFAVRGVITLPAVTSGEAWRIETPIVVNRIRYIGEDELKRHLYSGNILLCMKEI